MKHLIAIPPAVQAVLTRLYAAGFEAYVVGGCVRDSLRGVRPADWDIATAATPEQVLDVFKDNPTYTMGQRHGTVTVTEDRWQTEITTFRTEGTYSDHRRPDSVSFVVDIIEDLRRRDFTVNAMAYNDRTGLIDPFGGQADLQTEILRCVGDPKERFSEDALRILRGLRFAAVLGFSIEEQTAIALRAQKGTLTLVAAERIQEELTRLLCGKNAFSVLRDYRDVVAVAIPELAATFDHPQHNPHHIYDMYLHTLHVVHAVPADPILRWAALLHDIGKPACMTLDENGIGHFYSHAEIGADITRSVLLALRMDNNTTRKIEELVNLHSHPLSPDESVVKRMLNRIGKEQLQRLILLKKADTSALFLDFHGRIAELESVEETLERVLLQNDCFSLKGLSVKGNDITSIGVPIGPMVGRILYALLEDVIDGNCENERTALLRRAKELIREGKV